MSEFGDWPPDLLARVIKAMAPERVCQTCGEPQRRILNDRSGTGRQPAIAAHIRERRKAAGFTVKQVNEWFGYAEGVQHWESVNPLLARIPTPNDWPILKERLGLSDEFDDTVNGGNLAEYDLGPSANRHQTFSPGAGFKAHVAERKTADAGFTDCGHDDYRSGVVLDPFGTGITVEVAEVLGRDGIEIQPI